MVMSADCWLVLPLKKHIWIAVGGVAAKLSAEVVDSKYVLSVLTIPACVSPSVEPTIGIRLTCCAPEIKLPLPSYGAKLLKKATAPIETGLEHGTLGPLVRTVVQYTMLRTVRPLPNVPTVPVKVAGTPLPGALPLWARTRGLAAA